MADRATRPPDTRGVLRWMLGQLRIGPRRALAISLLATLATVGTVCAPLLYARITDVILDGLDADGPMSSLLWILIGAQTAVYAGVFVCSLGQGRMLNTAVQRCAAHLRSTVQRKVHRLPVPHLDAIPRGELLSKLTTHTDNATTVLGPVLVTVPTNLLTIAATTILLFALSPILACVVLAAAPVSAALATLVARRARPHLVDQWTTTAALTACVEEQLSNRRMIKVHNAEAIAQKRFDALNDRLLISARSAQWSTGTLAPTVTFVNALLFLALAALGGIGVVNGTLTLGVAQAIILLAQQLSSALRSLAGFYPRIQSATVSAAHVRELLDDTPDETGPNPAGPVPAHRRRPPEIVFDGVDFGYRAQEQVLHSVSFVLKPATTTAIVGSTGSGKTTLTRLLQGFGTPSSGRILIDDLDITEMSRQELRGSMAVVPQEPWLFTGTVRDNIAYGVRVPQMRTGDGIGKNATDAAIADAITASAGAQLIAALPDGLDTLVGDDAENLSTGEKQLVTVARAFAAAPSILILDEATSAADPHTELLIARALTRLRTDTTTLMVTHRLATAARADHIVVLENGRVVEVGTHDELLRREGYYAQRYTNSVTGTARPAAPAPPQPAPPPVDTTDPTPVRVAQMTEI
ncbi:ABC transporter ATP-binding protein [Gordonia sp. ABSL1-1]|uniref:ABC transporter ATP-binding protein n=1 Tax=Gordonia sp. ABSL1-1 TaxID=3053923 RepID=UPI002573A95B|nr:ABC transporter ATP-binding protein [Gordonia sp. ABSL1-1]MDL9937929.1 ABC transporter ATP-binding protein [Gordonia sp. ABSL1-1]